MAAPFQTVEEQLTYLVTCIKSAPEFKPNWTAVAEQMNLSSASAAQQRYTRLIAKVTKKGNQEKSGKTQNQKTSRTPTKGKQGMGDGNDSKGIKLDFGDDEDMTESPSKKRKVSGKAEPKSDVVKEEKQE